MSDATDRAIAQKSLVWKELGELGYVLHISRSSDNEPCPYWEDDEAAGFEADGRAFVGCAEIQIGELGGSTGSRWHGVAEETKETGETRISDDFTRGWFAYQKLFQQGGWTVSRIKAA